MSSPLRPLRSTARRTALACLATGLLAPQSAVAAVSTTKVTSSTATKVELIDGAADAPAPLRTFSGTSDGAPGDRLDLKARTSDGLSLSLATGISISAGGGWAWSGSIAPLAATVPADPENPLTSRRILSLAAVPSGNPAAAPGSETWQGTAFTIDVWKPVQGEGLSHPSDFLFSGTGSLAWNRYNGFDSCGLCDAGLISADGSKATPLWVWNASVDGPDQRRTGGGQTPSITVDGKAAYASFFAGALAGPAAVRPDTAFRRSVDPLTGAATVTEHHPLMGCERFPVEKPADCPQLLPTGLALNRTIRISPDGASSTIEDSIASIDGKEHTWEIHYVNAINRGAGGVAWLLPGARQWSLAKAPASQPDGQSDWIVTRGLANPTTMQVKTSLRAAASPASPAGSITVSPRPLRLWFPKASSDRMTIDMGGTVQAGGTASVRFEYAISTRPSTTITGMRRTAGGLFVWVRTDRPGLLSLRASTARRPIVAVCNAAAVAVPKGVSRLLCSGPSSTVGLAVKGSQLNVTLPFTAAPWAELRNTATAVVG